MLITLESLQIFLHPFLKMLPYIMQHLKEQNFAKLEFELVRLKSNPNIRHNDDIPITFAAADTQNALTLKKFEKVALIIVVVTIAITANKDIAGLIVVEHDAQLFQWRHLVLLVQPPKAVKYFEVGTSFEHVRYDAAKRDQTTKKWQRHLVELFWQLFFGACLTSRGKLLRCRRFE